MTRNLDNRVEVGCFIDDEGIKKELIDTFEISWNDNVKARVFNGDQDNQYRKTNGPEVRSQIAMYEYYRKKLKS
jgi:polyphosphate kinase